MMVSSGENIMWVSNQMGHINTQMVMDTYGKWIPDVSLASGYQPLNDWGQHLNDVKKCGELCPADAPQMNEEYEKPFIFNRLDGGERGIRTLDTC